MTLIIVFCLAALVTFGITRFPKRHIDIENERLQHPIWRAEGLIALMATLLATAVGLIFSYVRVGGDAWPLRNAGAVFLFATGMLYLLLLLRAWRKFPTWVGDLALIAMATISLAPVVPPSFFVFHLPFTNQLVDFGALGLPLAVFWCGCCHALLPLSIARRKSQVVIWA